jgi:hypothetical protein
MARRKSAQRVDDLEARVAALEEAKLGSWLDRPSGLAALAGLFALLAADIAASGAVVTKLV